MPRDLKAAIKRLHANLGHCSNVELLRALRISKASEAAIKSARLFQCSYCLRARRPDLPKPSRLPTVDEFGVVVGFDVFSEKDSDQVEWQFLNIVDMGSSFQVVAVLGESNKVPSATAVLEAYEKCWGS